MSAGGGLVWIDGVIRPAAEAGVGVADRGLLLGHAAFETVRCTDGRLRRWPAHRARLEGGLAYLGVARPAVLDHVEAGAEALAQRQGLSDAVARLTVTAGEAGPGLEGDRDVAPRVILSVKARTPAPSAVSTVVFSQPRRSGSPGERFKLSGYGDLIAARAQARAAGADRAIVCGPGGVLACADCANLFWIRAESVFTPALATGALPGVTRAAMLTAAQRAGIDIKEVCAAPSDLDQAQAAFMTNAGEGVTAIASVNGRALDPDHALIDALSRLEAD